MLHPNEMNNIAYIALRWGHAMDMDKDLWSKIKAELSAESTVEDVVNAACDHAWRLNGKPDKDEYDYEGRRKYGIMVANKFMTYPEEQRRDLSVVPATAMANRRHALC